MRATEKQVGLAICLMEDCGFNAVWLDESHQRLGAAWGERYGLIRPWLRGMSRERIGKVIGRLRREKEARR